MNGSFYPLRNIETPRLLFSAEFARANLRTVLLKQQLLAQQLFGEQRGAFIKLPATKIKQINKF